MMLHKNFGRTCATENVHFLPSGVIYEVKKNVTSLWELLNTAIEGRVEGLEYKRIVNVCNL